MLMKEECSQYYILRGSEPDFEELAIGILQEKIDYLLEKLIDRTKRVENQESKFEMYVTVGSFHKIAGGIGFRKAQSKRLLLFLIRKGKIVNCGKKGLRIVKL